MLLLNPVPNPPTPKDSYSAKREEEALRSQAEIAGKLIALVEVLESFTPTEILDSKGQILTVLAQAMGQGIPGAGGSITNFQLIVTGPNSIRVRQGIVNAGGASWLPDGMTEGDAEPYVLTVGSEGYIILIVTVNAEGLADSVTIGDFSSIPADSETVGHIVLGSYGTTSGGELVATGAVGDLGYIHCGGEHYFWGI